MSKHATVYLNPNCSKCRELNNILETKEVPVVPRYYLESPPDAQELRDIMAKLDAPASSLLRGDEDDSEPASALSEDAIVERLLQKPERLQRPIVIYGDKAVIARPPQRVSEIIL